MFFFSMLNLSGSLQSTNHCVRNLKLVNNSPAPWGRVAVRSETQQLNIQSATQPFLVSSPNAPPHSGEERCVTTLKTAVQQTTKHKDHVVTMTTSKTILTLSSPLCIAGSCSPAAAWIHCWTASGRRSLIIRMYSSARALFFCLQEYTRKNHNDSLIFRDVVFSAV